MFHDPGAHPTTPRRNRAGGVILIAAFVTDCTYYTTALWQWANFSAWLITAG